MAALLENTRPAKRVPRGPGGSAGRDDGVLAHAGPLEVLVARERADIERALRLRYRVFAVEFGAALDSAQGLDRDVFDPYCEHLIVRHRETREVVGTYRLLLPEQAEEVGCLYSDGEFLLARLESLRPRMVELGRSCVHADYRSGATIMLLWSGLGTLLAGWRLRYLIGCVSVSIRDGGDFAASLYHSLARTHLADEPMRVWPRRRLPIERFDHRPEAVPPPPLMNAYLRAGARLLGEPHVDASFACADFPMMLDLDALHSRYRRRFAASPAAGMPQ